MKKLTMTLVTIFAVTTLAASAFAFGPGWGRGHGGGQCYRSGNYAGDIAAVPGINLTTEQTAKLNALRDANLRDIKPLQDKMYSKRGDLRLLWLQTNPDEKKILATQKDVRVLRDQMHDKMTSHRIEVLKVLTPEQQEKLKSYGPGRGFGPGMKGGPGHHGGGPGMGMMRGNW